MGTRRSAEMFYCAQMADKMGVGMMLADSIKSEVASEHFKILKVSGLDLTRKSYIV
jgi:hypothetical protein